MAEAETKPDESPPAERERQPPRPWAVRALAAFADWFWANAVVGLFGIWLAGQWFRDGSKVTALCLLVPSAAIGLGLLATAVLARLCTCRRLALAAVVLSIPPAILTLLVENRWIAPKPQGDPTRRLRVVHWNIGPSKVPLAPKIAVLQALEADAYMLSEVYSAEAAAEIAKALGSDVTFVQRHNLVVFARGPTRFILKDARISQRAYFVEWDSPQGTLRMLLVDTPSTYTHGGLLRDVRARIAEHRPDIAAGDFNASRRTRALARLPEGYAHAYNAVGTGWSATWHDRYPIWDIDQCVLGPRILPIRYRLRSTGLSDHRLGIFDFSVREKGAD